MRGEESKGRREGKDGKGISEEGDESESRLKRDETHEELDLISRGGDSGRLDELGGDVTLGSCCVWKEEKRREAWRERKKQALEQRRVGREKGQWTNQSIPQEAYQERRQPVKRK